MALIYGLGLIGFETVINWGQWQWWPWWLVDYAAAAVLVIGGILTLQQNPMGRTLLACGWGFALGMMWMSLAGNIEQGADPQRAARVAGFYIPLIAASMIYALAGLMLCIRGKARRH